MKRKFQKELKQYLRNALLTAREANALTQEKMAPQLHISTRALSSVEDGVSCFSLVTFLFFCYRFCPDTGALMQDIFSILRNSEDSDS